MRNNLFKNKKGQSLVEIIVALAIFSLVALATSILFLDSITSLRVGNELNEASALAYEGVDAARSIRDSKWLDLTNGTHGLTTGSGFWEFSGSSEAIGDYTRTVTVADVDRDSSFDIIVSGTKDPRTKLVTTVVSWNSRGSLRSTVAAAYLTDWNVFDWKETTDGEFGSGSLVDTTVNGTGDGASLILVEGTGTGGGDSTIWVPGGGESETHDLDTDFSPGTFADMEVTGIGTSAQLALSANDQWTEYVARGDGLDEMYDVDIQDVSTGWAVGRDGNIVRQAGGAWYAINSPIVTDLNAVFIVDNSSEGWALGDAGKILRWDGNSWFEASSPTPRDIYAVSQLSATDAWGVGANGEIIHYDGGSWTTATSPTGAALYGVDTFSSTFSVIVGFNGLILHYNGTSWSSVTSPVSEDLRGIHIISSTDAWATGDNGTIIHWDGVSWSTVTSPTSDNIQDVYMTSAAAGWAVVGELASTKSDILQYDGVSWTSYGTPTEQPYYALDFAGSNGAIAAGRRSASAEGAILETSGVDWTVQLAPSVSVDLNDIEMSGASFGITVGNGGVVQHWGGSAWAEKSTPIGSNLNAVSIISSDDIWAVGAGGDAIQWDGDTWSSVVSTVSKNLYGVDAVTSSDIWAVGQQKTLIHWNGSVWSSTTIGGANKTYYDVEMVSSSDGWFVGQSGVIFQYNGSSWSSVSSPTSQQLNNLSVVDASNIWAAGNSGTILYWDGASWVIQSTPVSTDLESIYMESDTEGWAVGASGEILSWDGVLWTEQGGITANNLFGVHYVAADDIWTTGQSGNIFHYTEAFADSGTFESDIIDSNDVSADWGFTYWVEDIIGGTTDVTIATRTGSTATPDGSWSAWSAEVTDKLGSAITSPDNQYLQYRVSFTTNDTQLTPKLDEITFSWNEPTTNHLYAVSMDSTSTGNAVGISGTATDFNGSNWSPVLTGDSAQWNGVDEISSSNSWAVTSGGGIWNYNGSTWSSVASPTGTNLTAVDMDSASKGFAVGESGTILVYTGSWAADTSPTVANLSGVSVHDSTNGWAVGAGGVIAQLSSGTWSTVASPTVSNLYDVHSISSSSAWAVGAGGVIIEWNGSSWSTVTSPTSSALNGVDFGTATDAFAVGDSGTVIHYNGIGWQNVNSPTASNLNAVDMVSDTFGWAVGDSGAFAHVGATSTVTSYSFIDDEQSEFNLGTYSDTAWNTDHVELDATGLTNGTGTFSSRIFDTTDSSAAWANIAWEPTAPYGKELPDNAVTETGYAQGNASMTNNVMLLHMDESSGTVLDTSGQGNDGTESGGVTYGTSAILNTGLSFDGVDDLVTVTDTASLDIADDITLEAWVDWVSGTGGGGGTPIGDIASAATDSFEFDTSAANEISVIHVSGNVYAIAYMGSGSDGFVATVTIDSAGNITSSVIDSLEFNTQYGGNPDIIHVSGDIFAIAHRGNGSDGFLTTVDIDSAGNIANSTVDTWEFDTTRGVEPDIIHISGDVYAIVYSGNKTDGWLGTVNISTSGTITGSFIDSFEFDTSNAIKPKIINVGTDIYAIAYTGSGNDGWVKTIDIDVSGTITTPAVGSFEFDAAQATDIRILNISGTVYALLWTDSAGDGQLGTITISGAGGIAGSLTDQYEYEATDASAADMVNVAGNVFAISYTDTAGDGQIVTTEIDTGGNITGTIIDSFEFDTADAANTDLFVIASGVYLMAYSGPGADGFLTTVDIATTAVGGSSGVGIAKSGAYSLLVDGTTAYAVINGTTVSSATLTSGFNHVAMTYDKDLGSSQIKLYVNGIQASTGTLTDAITTNTNNLVIGEDMEGVVDEVALFSEALSATSILDHYKRGALDLQFQVRSCNDAACSGESFIGPSGTGSDSYRELNSSTLLEPTFTLQSVSDNQYFQYQVVFSTLNASYSPELESVTSTYQLTTLGGGSGTGYGSPGTFESQILNSDSTGTSWETLFWSETLALNTDATIAVRSGDTSTPDGSWSSWSSEFTDENGGDLFGQSGQYLQYRVTLSTSDSASTPIVADITVTYK